jgi:hypothetical protein
VALLTWLATGLFLGPVNWLEMGTAPPDDKNDLDPQKFGENGLLVMGVLGGFALATLALVISQQQTFAPKSLDWSTGII